MNRPQSDPIDLMELAKALWKNILAIALAAIVGGAAVFGYTVFSVTPTYTAKAALYVNSSTVNLGSMNFSVSAAELSTSSSLVNTYIYILKSRTTLEEIIKEADLAYTPETLGRMITASGVNNTSAFEVTVTSTKPAESELIANTVAKVLPDRITEIVQGSTVRIVDYAIIPSHRSGPDLVANTLKGVAAGVVLSAGIVTLFFLLNDKSKLLIKSSDELREMYPDVMVLAMIPDMRYSEKKNSYYSSYYGNQYTSKQGGKKNGK